jgi:WD40 repeat protein
MKIQVGGALRPGALYVQRAADAELLRALHDGEICTVLAPRQSGKSSLRTRTARSLEQAGVRCAMVDLASLGVSGVREEDWFAGLLIAAADSLDLDPPIARGATPVARWLDGLRRLVVAVDGPLVLQIDEIDAIRSLPFAAHELLAALRVAADGRAADEVWGRLGLCLLGVATPTDLVVERHRSPFDVGRRVHLRDFNLEQARALLPGLQGVADPEACLREVMAWTSGHPGMTTTLCVAAVEQPGVTLEALVQQRMLAAADPTLASISAAVLNAGTAAGTLLSLWRRIVEAGAIAAEPGDVDQHRLLLTGIATVQHEGGRQVLRPRNRVVTEAFDRAWLDRHQGRRLLSDRAWAWVRAGRRQVDLLRVDEIAELATWAQGRDDLGVEETELLLRSQAAEARRVLQGRLQWLGTALVVVLLLALAGSWWARQRALRTAVLQAANDAPRLAASPGRSADGLRHALEAFSWVDGSGRAAAADGLARTLHAVRGPRWDLGCGRLVAALWVPPEVWVGCGDGHVLRIDPESGRERGRLAGHAGPVRALAAVPGGVVSGGEDGALHLWLADGTARVVAAHGAAEIEEDLANLPGEGAVRGIRHLEVRGARLLSLAADGARLWTLAGEPVATLGGQATGASATSAGVPPSPGASVSAGVPPSPGGPAMAAPSPGGASVVPAGSVAAVQLPAGGSVGWAGDVVTAALSPDGAQVVTAGVDGAVRLWSAHDGLLLQTWAVDAPWLMHCAWSPDGAQLAVVGASSYLLRPGSPQVVPLPQPVRAARAAWSPDGRHLAVGHAHGLIRVWSPTPLAVDWELRHATDQALDLAWTDSGVLLAATDDDAVRAWRDATPLWTSFIHASAARRVLPVGERVFTPSRDGSLAALRVVAPISLATWRAPSAGSLAVVDVGPRGEVAVATAGGRAWWTHEGQARPLPDGDMVAFLADGSLAVGFDAGAAVLDGALVERGRLEGQLDRQPSLSRADRVVTFTGREVLLWTLPGLGLVSRAAEHEAEVQAVALSSDGQRLVSGDAGGGAVVWDARTGAALHRLEGHPDAVTAVAWSPDGAVVATAGMDDAVRLWEASTGGLLRTLAMDGNPRVLLFTPDGERVVVAQNNRVVRVWPASGDGPPVVLRGHTMYLRDAALSADGHTLATVSDDGTLRLWDVAHGQAVATMEAGEGAARAVGFVGGQVVAGGEDGVLRWFPGGSEGLVGVARGWGGGDRTHDLLVPSQALYH